jgi:Tat protein translocase TatB subunit
MFDVGFAELVLLFVIGLLVLGPERLPKVAAEIGRWVGRARRTATQLRRQLEREVELNEVIQPPRPTAQPSPAPDKTQDAAATVATNEAGATGMTDGGPTKSAEQSSQT